MKRLLRLFCVLWFAHALAQTPPEPPECGICSLLLDVPPGYEELTPGPTPAPSPGPTAAPSPGPSAAPTAAPSAAPSPGPTAAPSRGPTAAPSAAPSRGPTAAPSRGPTAAPSAAPSPGPTATRAPAKHWWDGLGRTHLIVLVAGAGLILCGGLYSKLAATDPAECDERGDDEGRDGGALPSEERQWRFGQARIGGPGDGAAGPGFGPGDDGAGDGATEAVG